MNNLHVSVAHVLSISVPNFCSKIRGMFDAVKPLFDSLGRIIGQNDYYRYHILVTMNIPKLPEHNTACSSGMVITGGL